MLELNVDLNEVTLDSTIVANLKIHDEDPDPGDQVVIVDVDGSRYGGEVLLVEHKRVSVKVDLTSEDVSAEGVSAHETPPDINELVRVLEAGGTRDYKIIVELNRGRDLAINLDDSLEEDDYGIQDKRDEMVTVFYNEHTGQCSVLKWQKSLGGKFEDNLFQFSPHVITRDEANMFVDEANGLKEYAEQKEEKEHEWVI